MPTPITQTEKLLWWLDCWFWWATNGWFRAKATEMQSRRSVVVEPPEWFVRVYTDYQESVRRGGPR